MSVDARGVIAGTLTLAALLVGVGRTAGAASHDAKLLHDNLNAQFSTWLWKDANVKPVRESIPSQIDVWTGKPEFPASTTRRWVFKVPEVSLGDRTGPAQKAPTELLRAYVTADGKQALESVPEASREETRRVLIANADAQIDDKPVPSKPTQPPTPIVSPTKWLPLASEQCLVPGRYYLCSPLASTALAEAIENDISPYELYWSGYFDRAVSRFRVITAAHPDDAVAWYFQAIAELATGDSVTAQSTLQKAAATEARMKSTRDVSFALVRVQGPVRVWVEAARRAVANQPAPSLTVR